MIGRQSNLPPFSLAAGLQRPPLRCFDPIAQRTNRVAKRECQQPRIDAEQIPMRGTHTGPTRRSWGPNVGDRPEWHGRQTVALTGAFEAPPDNDSQPPCGCCSVIGCIAVAGIGGQRHRAREDAA